MWPRSARVERPFPALSIPCGCEAYPRDLLVDWVWCGSRELILWSQKSGDITIANACGDVVVVVSEAFIPSICDVFVWRSLLFNVTIVMRLRCDNIRVESLLIE